MIPHFIDEELEEWGSKMTFSGTYSLLVAKSKFEIVSLAVKPWLLTPGLGPQARRLVEVKGAFTFTGFFDLDLNIFAESLKGLEYGDAIRLDFVKMDWRDSLKKGNQQEAGCNIQAKEQGRGPH